MTASGETADAALVRRTFELFNARDAEGIVALMDPDGQLFPYAIVDRRHDGYHGHDGLRQYMADIARVFESFEVDIAEIKDVGDGTVLAEGRIRGRGADGTIVDMAAAWLWTVRDGRLTRMQAHPTSAGRAGA